MMNCGTPLLEQLNEEEAVTLCRDLRQNLVQSVSQTGGHLSSNLGMVELTVALHRVYDTSIDRLVFDVGHQCYPHKMLTGRKEAFATLRQYQGMAGFPKPSESIHDAFVAGHASNSIAVAVGMAQSRDLLDKDHHVIALLGDGALTGGLAYEGLGIGGQGNRQLLVILNDNGMSITKNVGAMSSYLSKQRLKPQYLRFRKAYRHCMNATSLGRTLHRYNHRVKQGVKSSLLPCSFFEQMGFTYYGPVDGHDVTALTQILHHIKEIDEPVFLHVHTTKGKDYLPAEEKPHAYHGVPPFQPDTGELPSSQGTTSFSATLGETLVRLAENTPELCAITAAMPTGTGLDIFGDAYPSRLYDVGIAEGCAVAMAGGMAKEGAIPVFAVYSTFLQRSYDMMIHDVALLKLPVIYAIDRAGLVGEDGETHHGVFDVALLSTIPHLTLLAPSSLQELRDMLTWAVTEQQGTVALRYPRGSEGAYVQGYSHDASDVIQEGSDLTLVTYGSLINGVMDCATALVAQGFSPEVIKLNRLSPLQGDKVMASVEKTGRLLVVEEVVSAGSVGERLAHCLSLQGIPATVRLVNLGDDFVTHGKLQYLYEELGMDVASLVQHSLEVMSHGEERTS